MRAIIWHSEVVADILGAVRSIVEMMAEPSPAPDAERGIDDGIVTGLCQITTVFGSGAMHGKILTRPDIAHTLQLVQINTRRMTTTLEENDPYEQNRVAGLERAISCAGLALGVDHQPNASAAVHLTSPPLFRTDVSNIVQALTLAAQATSQAKAHRRHLAHFIVGLNDVLLYMARACGIPSLSPDRPRVPYRPAHWSRQNIEDKLSFIGQAFSNQRAKEDARAQAYQAGVLAGLSCLNMVFGLTLQPR